MLLVSTFLLLSKWFAQADQKYGSKTVTDIYNFKKIIRNLLTFT